MTDPGEMTPRDAVQRYLDNRRPEITDGTYSSYYYRLKLFVEWCEREGVAQVQQIDGWTIDEFRADRAAKGIESSTLHNEMETLEQFCDYLERIEAVDEGLAGRVDVPDVPKDERSRDKMLEPDDAKRLLEGFRSSERHYASKFHVLLELAWHTGARLGALRALDLRDIDLEEDFIKFVHRPETGTSLKKKRNGERMVSLLPEVTDVLSQYIRERSDVHDDYGRQPLLITAHRGRPSENAIRSWMYQATFPCRFSDCPHGKDPSTCEFRNYTSASGCPSSRSPHHVRTGSITWHRDRGLPPEITANRVNAAVDTIEEYYDKASQREAMENRRRPHIEKLSLKENVEN